VCSSGSGCATQQPPEADHLDDDGENGQQAQQQGEDIHRGGKHLARSSYGARRNQEVDEIAL
jgi:hypothetical protein